MAENVKRALTDKFMLRLPDGMRDRIKAAADANGRSMNAEIIATLDENYPLPIDPIVQDRIEEFWDLMKYAKSMSGNDRSLQEAISRMESKFRALETMLIRAPDSRVQAEMAETMYAAAALVIALYEAKR